MNRRLAGFTLLELSVVLTLAAVVMAGGMAIFTASLTKQQQQITNARLDKIDKALHDYAQANSYLPCPADITAAYGAATYGVGTGTDATACSPNSSTVTCTAANFTSGNTVAGLVPVKTLRLNDEDAIDGWGNRILYVADQQLTAASSIGTGYGLSTSPLAGTITINDASGNAKTTTAAYALVSYGPDGHGAYPRNGGTTRVSKGVTNTNSLQNCFCHSDGTTNSFSSTFVQKDSTLNPGTATDVFDDVVRYGMISGLTTASGVANPCPSNCTAPWGGTVNAGNSVTAWSAAAATSPTLCTSQSRTCTAGVLSGTYTNQSCTQTCATATVQGVAKDYSGWSVAVGDVNGDGIPDLIIGAPGCVGCGLTGKAYVVFGTTTGFPDPLPLSGLNGTNGFELDGPAANIQTGYSVAAGDVNGDGYADIIIGAYETTISGHANAGSVYVVFGGATGADHSTGPAWSTCPCTLNSTFLNGTNGFELDGAAAGDDAGFSLATGDVNGDGIADLVIGAAGANSQAGSVYIVFGKASGWSGTAYTLNAAGILNGTNGFELDGAAANIYTGKSVAAGDVNGDGYADIVTGAYYATAGANADAGKVDVVFGGKGPGAGPDWSGGPFTLNSTFLNGVRGFELDGAAASDYAGSSVATGDINGDGYADIVIGAYGETVSGNTRAGAVYVVFGKAGRQNSWSSTPYTLNTASILNGTNGFELDGAAASDYAGSSVATGDINGDGKADIIIGAYQQNSDTGAAYVVYGGTGPKSGGTWSSAPYVLNAAGILNTTNGVELDGTATGNYTATSLAVGDVNGDGKADLIVGAYRVTVGGNSGVGSTYVIYGPSSGWASSPISVDFGGACTPTAGTTCTSPWDTTIANGGTVTAYQAANVYGASTCTSQVRTCTNGVLSGSYTYQNCTAWGNGFHIDGVAANDLSGSKVAVGDVNGDGIPDIIITTAATTNKLYVVFGTKTGFPDPLPLSTLNGTNGFQLIGDASHTFSTGWPLPVAAADINGDGYADIIIGGVNNSVGGITIGSVYVVFGGKTGMANSAGPAWTSCPCTVSAALLNGTNGFELDGEDYDNQGGDWTGWSIATGDVNGDGYADILVSEPVDPYNAYGGTVFVVFGKASGWPGTASTLASFANGTNGFVMHGVGGSYGDYIGWIQGFPSAHGLATGDVNGDGKADIIIGAPAASLDGTLTTVYTGKVYVVFGKSSGWSATYTFPTLIDGTNGFELDGVVDGVSSYPYTGTAVAAGDINGDGYADILIGSPGTTIGGHTSAGVIDVVFGKVSGWSGTATILNATFLNGTNGFQLYGVNANDQIGIDLAAGDLNGDGIADLVMGNGLAHGSGHSKGGNVGILFGKTSGWPTTPTQITTAYFDGTKGFELDGAASSNQAGMSVAVGDVNRDGYGDIIIGAPKLSPHGSSSGETYIYYGHPNSVGWPTTPYSLGGL